MQSEKFSVQCWAAINRLHLNLKTVEDIEELCKECSYTNDKEFILEKNLLDERFRSSYKFHFSILQQVFADMDLIPLKGTEL